MEKLLVVTYTDDLLQFEMFCYCLNKNWQGNPHLIVVASKNTDVARVKQIVDKTFSSNWTVDIKETAYPYADGYIEQQVNKIFYSINSNSTDVIVFDSKDFLLRPCTVENFKTDNKYNTTFNVPGQKLIDLYPDITQVVDADVSELPAVLNLTPWIWNVEQLNKYWNYINDRFGSYQSWNNFPAGTEIYGFYIYTWNDQTSTMDWQSADSTPLLLGGGWTHQTYEGMLQEAVDFERWPERVIWKHSRKLEDPCCLEVTKSVLLKHNINQTIIDQVFG